MLYWNVVSITAPHVMSAAPPALAECQSLAAHARRLDSRPPQKGALIKYTFYTII